MTERRLRTLLGGYFAARGGVAPVSKAQFGQLLDGFHAKFHAWRKSEETSAADFNLLDTLQIASEEAIHARMLTWLLDHRIEHYGTHAQGNLGFQRFLAEVGLARRYAESNYWVQREVCGDESRMDIEVAAFRKFVIHIEVKIYSEEGEEQTTREWRDLQRRGDELCVDPDRVHGFFLTLTGEEPSSKRFSVLRWKQIADVLDSFAERARAPEVMAFAGHYARALRRMSIQQTHGYEEDDHTDIDA